MTNYKANPGLSYWRFLTLEHRQLRWLFAATGLFVSAIAYGKQSVNVDGKQVSYWPSARVATYAEFQFDMKGYRNTYTLDCHGRRFLWTRNVRISTGKETKNTADAEWRPLNQKSLVANTVNRKLCPRLLSGRPSGPEPYSANLSNPSQAFLAAVLAGEEAKIPLLVQRTKARPKQKRGDRKEARAWNSRGLESLNSGNTNDAVTYFFSAAKADPGDVEVIGNLGYALLVNEQPKEAKKVLALAISMGPERAATWANLGEAYAALGKNHNAVAAFRLTFLFSRNVDKTKEYLRRLMTKPESTATLRVAVDTVLTAASLSDAAKVSHAVTMNPDYYEADVTSFNQERDVRRRGPTSPDMLTEIKSLEPDESTRIVWFNNSLANASKTRRTSATTVLELFNELNNEAWEHVHREVEKPLSALGEKPVWRVPQVSPKGEFEKSIDYETRKGDVTEKAKAAYNERLREWEEQKHDAETKSANLGSASESILVEHLQSTFPQKLGSPELDTKYDADAEKFNITVTSPAIRDYEVLAELPVPITEARNTKKDILDSKANIVFKLNDGKIVLLGIVLVGDTRNYTVNSAQHTAPDFVFTKEQAQVSQKALVKRSLEEKREKERRAQIEKENKRQQEERNGKKDAADWYYFSAWAGLNYCSDSCKLLPFNLTPMQFFNNINRASHGSAVIEEEIEVDGKVVEILIKSDTGGDRLYRDVEKCEVKRAEIAQLIQKKEDKEEAERHANMNRYK